MHTSLLASVTGLLRRPVGLAVALAAALSGCTEVLVTPASSPPAGLAVVIQASPSSAGANGPGEAFDRADAVRLRIVRSESGLPTFEATLPLPAAGAQRRVGPLTLEMRQSAERVEVSLELLRGQDVLFRGSPEGSVELRAGQTATAQVAPVSVPGGVRVPESVADLTSLGDTVQLTGAVTFATGDDIPGLTLTWSTQQPNIVAVTPQGRVIALAEGTAVVVGTFEGFSRNLNVRVNPQVASVTLEPAAPQVTVGGTVQLSATLRDARGNLLTNRSVQSWTSSNEAIATVNGNGLVQGVAQGPATITATSGTASGTANVSVTATGPGTVTGRVVNALTAAAIVGATVDFGGGLTTTTNSSGNFSISVPAGTRSATISANGFASTTVPNIVVTAGATTNIGTVGLSPSLPEGQTRIVLTWSPSRDLDSHLRGPLPNSQSRFHVYYANPGSLSSSPFAFLDRDDLSGPGPETITITQSFPGVYRYGVYDFSSGGGPSSFLGQSSNARVRVFRGQAQVADFTVPNQAGNFWTVFEMDGATGAITPINTMSNQGPSSIQSVSQGIGSWHADAAAIAEAIFAQPKH